MFDICIHHMPCADGFTAAWAIWRRWPEITFLPGVYGAPPPDVAGKRILLVDFSYKRAVLQEMGRSAAAVTILDHHKSAAADLAPFAVEQLGEQPPSAFVDEGPGGVVGPYPIQARFDMEKSGAMLAWEFAHPGTPPPKLIRYVQDRDLWRFELPFSREISAVLFSHDYDFHRWNEIAHLMEDADGFLNLADQGSAIERKHHKDVRELLAMTRRSMLIGGHHVPVANLPYTLSSDGAGALAEGAPFGACYYDNAEGKRVFSLRSKDYGVDVSEVAVGYGGGGHARAAGFTAPAGWEGDASGGPA